MNYKNLFIGDFSDDDKNKTYINEPLESNTIKFTEDGFTVKFENGVELIHVANGVVIRVAQGKETPMKPDRLDGFRCRNCSGKLARQTDLVRQKYCHHCGQKLDWED
jgi:hypothetical protein